MNKQELAQTVKEMIAAPSCCQELKDAGQKWLDAAGTENAKAAADALAKEIKEDICTVDDVIGFFETADAVKLFGEETAKTLPPTPAKSKAKARNGVTVPPAPPDSASSKMPRFSRKTSAENSVDYRL